MSALGIAPLAEAFRAGADDPVRALERCLAAWERAKGDRALLWLVPGARAEAEAARARFREGRALGPLDGVPLVVKDCIDVAGLPTTDGTRFLREPVAQDAVIVSRLRAAGAVVFAKANMHELGILPTGVNPHHGTPVNPWAPDRIPGGSSSGCAVSVASGIAPFAIGTDAGGSVRVPAALNGLVGLKPTFGAVPAAGTARLTADLDHIGPLAWTAQDAAAAFQVISGAKVDLGVRVESPASLPDFFEGAEPPVAGAVRSAIREVFGDVPEVATKVCAWAGQIEFVMVCMQSAGVVDPIVGSHAAELGADAKVILNVAGAIPESIQRRATEGRARLREELRALLERHDVLLAPATGSFAPKLSPAAARTGELDTVSMTRLAAVAFPANLAGLPSCVVPCFREGLPVAMQIIGRAGDESRVLSAALRVERVFGPRRPPRWYGQD